MNNHPSQRLQTLTPDDMVYISLLAEQDKENLGRRCKRYRIYASIRRSVVAACIFVGCCLSYSSSLSAPLYDQITSSSEAGNQHICETVRMAIENV